MSAGTQSTHHQGIYVSALEMHAAACQQPATWLQSGSGAAAGGCCSPWQWGADGLQQPPVSSLCHVSWHPKHTPSGYICICTGNACSSMSTACNLAANWVRRCCSEAAAALGSGVPMGCNSPQCASLSCQLAPKAYNIRVHMYGIGNACSSMSTASRLAANCVCGCSSGLLQPLAVAVRKGCNSPKCAPLVMTAGTQSLNQLRICFSDA